ILGRMDPVDLKERIRAQEATLKRAEAQLVEARERRSYAQNQARRYEQLLAVRSTSEEIVATKKHELRLAEAGLNAAREELARLEADRGVLLAQGGNLELTAPVDGLVAARNADPGTTVVAGQAVIEVIDPESLWINVRFDQINARGLAADLPGRIVMRSQAEKSQAGRVLRVEPMADAVTEEILAKVVFEEMPSPLPPVGELAEVTITLPALPAAPVIPNAAIKQIDGETGVWRIIDGDLRFTPVTLAVSDLDGNVQVREGLEVGDRVVLYSANALNGRSRIKIVDEIPGVTR
ncbi:MAG: efflux RND transporter periplasmic adaptor subunit, partial [Desulfurivibrionaceae bacterium]